MVTIFLFLAIAFILTLLIGNLLEKIRVPWIFSAFLIGTVLSISNPFETITSSPIFEFLSKLGMYFLLFVIGFEIDLKKLKKSKRNQPLRPTRKKTSLVKKKCKNRELLKVKALL